MSSVRNLVGIPQLRCRAVTGGRSATAFRYELNVQGRWLAINHSFAAWVVGNGEFLTKGGSNGKRGNRAV
jgi:hypothetical protein